MNLTGPEVTVLVNILMLAGFFGGMSMLVKIQGKTLAKITESLEAQNLTLVNHGERIVAIETKCDTLHRGGKQ